MPQTAAILRHRRERRADRHRASATRMRIGWMGFGMLLSLVLALLILLAALAYANLTRDLPNIELLPTLLSPPDGLLLQPTQVFDRSGQHLLLTFAPSDSPRRYLPLNPASPQHLPDFLAQATVAAADPGFWSHAGYLWNGWQNPEIHPTIAQKLVSDLLLYSELPSPRRALRERILAAQITARYGRNQILEWYLNSANYGNHAFGVDAAAELYFGKSASVLTPAESAVLAAVSQAPSLNPFTARDIALQRGRDIIQSMKAFGLITDEEAAQALAESPIPQSPIPLSQASVAPAFVSLVLHQLDQHFTRERIERGGLTVITTLDYDLQTQAVCTTLVYAARLARQADPSAPCDAARLLPPLPSGGTVPEPSARSEEHTSELQSPTNLVW